MRADQLRLPRGILPVLQTPFSGDGRIDLESLRRLIDDAVAAGAAGLLAPAVASEVGFLARREREQIVRFVAREAAGRVPFIVGASADDPAECGTFARLAQELGAVAYVVAVPEALYQRPAEIPAFFGRAASGSALPLIIQDLQWNGPGLSMADLHRIRDEIPRLAGMKIETVPAGPKYTEVRQAFGDSFHVSGGWAVPQMIEALDRGVDAMVPEASMVRVYAAVFRLYESRRRGEAVALFRRLLPVVAFTNQEIRLSVAFFKALLVRKGIFQTETMRWPGFQWDTHNRHIAEELINLYLELEQSVAPPR